MNAQIEQVLKRLQDMLKLQSALLEQLSELGWITKDVIEDLVLALNDEVNPGARPGDPGPERAGQSLQEGPKT